ncbi:unnamed protein product [Mytilus edulis]|uniref:Uncharacterized protein n=1 Tax=Mytilus edulis TaxID=6550 RepID=A0A8S3V136_MYTED|nr:unnamed protein product [Mytilus edulis]
MFRLMAFLRNEAFLVSILFVLLYNSGLVTSYGIRSQEQPLVTGTTEATGGFGGACAACRYVCDCACVRRTCVDTSCCGEGGFAPETTSPSPVTSYGIRLQESPFVTETTGTPGGFVGACAACRAVCDCACVRRTCTDTSCCGEGGFAPGTAISSLGYRQDIFGDPWFRFLLSLQQKWRNHVKHAQWGLF